ncbi:helix-turn-helix domain-containing protein [Catellatospora tritici]|uniref:helix-turn-helix domain-containing protein n=1 Tax=Catellatospora tritici TaxID=2851566 RepID=UPI001C2DD10A|nr:helix-turn-helix transcriptional regulator [Catellatospora tritici]MBV1850039.1 helix-turn-helix domain-containing protein [Catellatospora tritici]
MTQAQPHFGAELRRLRLAAGYSLTEMVNLTYYSKSHLSKVENGLKPPSEDLARRCDALLGAAGELTRLAVAPPPAAPPARDTGRGVWLLRLDPTGPSAFTVLGQPESPRQRQPPRASSPLRTADGTTLDQFRALFTQIRQIGQSLDSDALLPMVAAQTHALYRVTDESTGADRRAAGLLTARYAEYAGWIAQEAGDDHSAVWWTEQAVELSRDAGDLAMASYALVRRALMAMYERHADQTVALARQAQDSRCGPRVRGLATLREAQGLALAGDHRGCLTTLDRAQLLLAQDSGEPGPVLGTSTVTDPVGLVTGWSLLDLGRPAEAAEVLRRELAHVPPHACRTRARFGARLARALAASAQVDEACAVADEVLDDYRQVHSATIGTDLRALGTTLRRWPKHQHAHLIGLRLAAAI